MANTNKQKVTTQDVGAAVAVAPHSVLLATDFDGTLSPIVDDPAASEMIPGALQAIEALAPHMGELAVISGRPVDFLVERFPAQLTPPQLAPTQLTLVGLYGLEQVRNGVRTDHHEAESWRVQVAELAATAQRAGLDGMRVELKGLSITLHYRGRPELAAPVEKYAQEVAAATGLVARSARMSVELHPPIDVDKGSVLLGLAAPHSGPVLFIGDDVGDLPAFDALDQLAGSGTQAFKIFVQSEESDAELLERADLVLDGPPAVLSLFQHLQTAVVDS